MGDDGSKDKRMILNGKGWTVQHSACDENNDESNYWMGLMTKAMI